MKNAVALYNERNELVRMYPLRSEKFFAIQRLDTGRLEIHASLEQLDADQISYTILEETSLSSLQKSGKQFGSVRLRALNTDMHLVQKSEDLADDQDEEKLKTSFIWSSGGHVIALAIIMLTGFIITKYFTPKKEATQAEMVFIPEALLKKEIVREQPVRTKPREVVKPVAQKIQKKAPVKKVVTLPKAMKPRTRAVTTGETVGPRGALGLLSSMTGSGGIGNKTTGKMGTGLGGKSNGAFGSAAGYGGGLGAGNTGGIKGALGGKGLVAGLAGSGSSAQGAGGYGNYGLGGGQNGRGSKSVGQRIGSVDVPFGDEVDLSGGLAREQIEAVVRKNLGQVLYCYEMGLQKQPRLSGRVTTEFMIAPSGGISTVKVAHSSLRDNSVESCILGKMRSWKFPKPVGGVYVDVAYPFDLRRLTSADANMSQEEL